MNTASERSGGPRRRYDATRRLAAAEQTKDAIAHAARESFAELGWSATTVREIARRAQVSEPTIYATYGGKEQLALALLDSLDAAAEARRSAETIASLSDNPAAQLAELVAYDRRLFERGGDLIVLVREAGRSQPDLAEIYRTGRARGRSTQHRVMSSWPAATLKPHLDPEEACDIYAGILNVDAYRTLVDERGWSPDRVEAFWKETTAALLLA